MSGPNITAEILAKTMVRNQMKAALAGKVNPAAIEDAADMAAAGVTLGAGGELQYGGAPINPASHAQAFLTARPWLAPPTANGTAGNGQAPVVRDIREALRDGRIMEAWKQEDPAGFRAAFDAHVAEIAGDPFGRNRQR